MTQSPSTAQKARLWLGYSAEHLRRKTPSRSNTSSAPNQRGLHVSPAQQESLPSNIGNLDEIAAPPPINPSASRHESHLEDRGSDALSEKEPRTYTDKDAWESLATDVYTFSYLVIFSIFGTLARLGLQALTSYPGAPVQTGIVWANVAGTLVLGFLAEDRVLFKEEWGNHDPPGSYPYVKNTNEVLTEKQRHAAVKKTLPLYIGITVGFCGSFTSFSAFMRDAFFALANALPVPVQHPTLSPPGARVDTQLNVHRNGGYSFVALLAVLILNLGLSLGALKVGAHLAIATERWMISVPFALWRKIVDKTAVFFAMGLWLGCIVMAAVPPDRPGGPTSKTGSWGQETWRSKALFSLVFAPLGCILRYLVSVALNGKIKAFPLGTFTVNIVGTALEAMFIDLQHAPVGGHIGCQVLQGMSDGFCGCLTTVSTWVAEINGLRSRHGYVYALSSMVVGVSFFIVICGSLMWSQGFKQMLCVT